MSDRELRLERLIPAPPESLFALWTEPELLVTWWGPEGYEVSAHALDVRPGGRWWTTVRRRDGGSATMSGVYRVVDPPRHLVFTWGFEEDGRRGHETEVALTFEAVPGGTRLVLEQRLFETKESRDTHHGGWSSSFEKLARAAQR